MSGDLVRLDEAGPVATITLNRPEALNAMSPPLMGELARTVERLEQDPGIKVAIITGAGRAFCAGQDLREAEAVEDGDAVRAVIERHYNPVIRLLRSLDIPVLAAVNGACGACHQTYRVAQQK